MHRRTLSNVVTEKKPSPSDRTDAGQGYVRVSLGGVAIGAMVIALTCLVVLVIVASRKNVEALPTIALALAIIAFVVQLIVFIVQAGATAAQSVRGQALHGELLELLAEIREQTQGTQVAVSGQNERLLEAALGKVSRERGLSEEGQQAVIEAAERSSGSEAGSQSRQYPARKAKPDDAHHLAILQSVPGDEEARVGLERLKALRPMQKLFLRMFGEDERKILEAGSGGAYDPGLASTMGLEEKGLVAEVPGSAAEVGKPFYRLTDSGRDLARLLVGDGELSDANHKQLDDIKKEITDGQEFLSG